jgi:hypothetical protein
MKKIAIVLSLFAIGCGGTAPAPSSTSTPPVSHEGGMPAAAHEMTNDPAATPAEPTPAAPAGETPAAPASDAPAEKPANP